MDDLKKFLEFKNEHQDSYDLTINKGFQELDENFQNFTPWFKLGQTYWHKRHQLSLANRVVHNNQIKLSPGFVNNVEQYFKGDIQSADLDNNSVVETKKINDWVRNNTKNRIQKLFENPIDRDVSIIIINVLYFKGN